jgi:hypothetical protein
MRVLRRFVTGLSLLAAAAPCPASAQQQQGGS